MGHGHSHGGEHTLPEAQGKRARLLLAALTVPLLLATLLGMFLLWPAAGKLPPKTALLAPGVNLEVARVQEVPPDKNPREFVKVSARGLTGPIAGKTIEVSVPPEVFANGTHRGSEMRVMGLVDQGEDGKPVIRYSYFDMQRSTPMLLLFGIYLLVVAAVARGRGLRAVVGLAASVAVVVFFMLPSLLAGNNPLLVGMIGASAMMFPAVYLAHGISIRTTTALWGTIAGAAVTLVMALLAAGPTGMTGTQGEAPSLLYGSGLNISLSTILLAGVLISGLGALNDVTITQASAVWELRAAMPNANRLRVFTSAMRIGRDHIASTVYTLAFAYIGTALPVLLVAATIERSFLDTLLAGEIAEEIFRTLVASIGLVLAIPLTTGIAALLAGKGDAESEVPLLAEADHAAERPRGRRARRS
ncbi:YibE/F family protein [Dermabacteraceae bacterium P13101]